ncbi:hypothetical protein [Azotobacter beijerinckii]|uniref:hypothetical protein n=1 Tax=Azotobacter beijerinckii TaxID=170623 RepID=UPI002952D6AA|nr:hypothetical protein [Azotobacter beijerinckii]MDV7210240.1 hypothetical protein [Azotobacter beijerinckii]
MSNFPKRKVLLSGFLALFLGATLQLPAMAAQDKNEPAAADHAKEHPKEHQGGTPSGEHKMSHEEHEKMMEDMHEEHMGKGGMDHGSQTAPDDEKGDYEDDDSEE